MLNRPRAQSRSFLAAVLIAGILCFLPSSWLGWADGLADIVAIPTVPFGHFGTRMTAWFRGGPVQEVGDPRERARLQAQLNRYRVLYHAAQRRLDSLEEQIEQLQRAKVEGFEVAFHPQSASIVGRNTASAGEIYTVNVGANRNVRQGDVAVYDGSHLIGRISSVAPLTSSLVPITSPAIDLIEAYIAPAEADDPRNNRRRPRTMLRAVGDATLSGDLPRETEPQVGDYVLLDDPTWPATARSMILGRVISVTPKDENPLFVRIVVRPRYVASKLASVTIKIDTNDSGRVAEADDPS